MIESHCNFHGLVCTVAIIVPEEHDLVMVTEAIVGYSNGRGSESDVYEAVGASV